MLGHLTSPPPLVVLDLYSAVNAFTIPLPVSSNGSTPFFATSGGFSEAELAAELANRDPSNTLWEVLDGWVNNDLANLHHARYGDRPKPTYGERQKIRRVAHECMAAQGVPMQTLFQVDDQERQVELLKRKEREMSVLLLLNAIKTYPPPNPKEKGVPAKYAKIEGQPYVCDQYEVENSVEWK
ncbi:hypothetical protein FRB97_001854 [Tulasnella sp. 331]|nr:hypothetical protein FRB97_001854 [Tulasnella sp. 331]